MTDSAQKLCLYPIADAMQVTLYFDAKAVAKAHTQRTLNIGPWGAKADIMVHCDHYDNDSASGIVKIRKDLWGYIWYERKAGELLLALFKKPEGLKSMEIDKFLKTEFMKAIRPNVKAVFTSKEQEGWERAEIAVLDERLEREGFKLAEPSTAD